MRCGDGEPLGLQWPSGQRLSVSIRETGCGPPKTVQPAHEYLARRRFSRLRHRDRTRTLRWRSAGRRHIRRRVLQGTRESGAPAAGRRAWAQRSARRCVGYRSPTDRRTTPRAATDLRWRRSRWTAGRPVRAMTAPPGAERAARGAATCPPLRGSLDFQVAQGQVKGACVTVRGRERE